MCIYGLGVQRFIDVKHANYIVYSFYYNTRAKEQTLRWSTKLIIHCFGFMFFFLDSIVNLIVASKFRFNPTVETNHFLVGISFTIRKSAEMVWLL